MPKKKYDLAVFIGRLQPLHQGHIRNINLGLEIADHVLVIAGSANQPRRARNPFTVEERTQMVKAVFPTGRVQVRGVEDYYPDARWLESVQSTVHHHILSGAVSYSLTEHANSDTFIDPSEAKIAILGHDKDHTSFYLKKFPKWDFIEIGDLLKEGEVILDATDIRDEYFEHGYGAIGENLVHREVLRFLIRFRDTEEYQWLKNEDAYNKRYKKEWANTPHPVIFQTTDAVVVQSGYVLLVRRKTAPGKGLWALPGGFLGYNERFLDSCIRELFEETRLKVPMRALKKSVVGHEYFDDPNRSERGRVVTHAFLFDLEDQPKLPKVKGSDDAAEAKWFPLDLVGEMSNQLFEDHSLIIKTMVARLSDRTKDD